ncbi:MAG: ABC transporter ATP-binding protein [Bacilli bacterium]|nr:ABC transporter ATP-binding protein [Bacilli bacterium]
MIRKVIKSLREYKKYAILTPLCVLIEVILEVLIPFLMSRLIDDGIQNSNISVVYEVGIILVICAFISLFFGIASGVMSSKASNGFAKNLRRDLYLKVQDFSFHNIDKFQTSSLITRLTTDVSNIQFAFQMIIRIAARAPLMLIVSIIFAMRINPKVAIIYLIVGPLLGFILITIAKRAHPIMKNVFETYDGLNEVVEENVSGIRVVKSFTLEEREKKKFHKVSEKIYKLFVKGERMIALNGPFMQISMYTCMIFICWVGAHLIVSSGGTTLTTGNLMTLFTYTTQILGSLMMLSVVFVISTISRGSLERICEVLDEKVDVKNPEKPIYNVFDGSIKFNNVSFSYIGDKNKEALKNINIDIKSGETIGIIGGTGSGKTSLVNLLPRLYDVTEGELLIGGVDVRNYDLKTLRDSVACVLQKNVLFTGTILDNLKWGKNNITLDDARRACKLAQIDDFIMSLPDKYDTYLEEGGVNLSGGQKQRLCIARALLKNPNILILDDSTSAVDTRTDRLIQDAFIKEIPNTTKIIIAQRINSVMDADKIIVLDNGKINGIGKHQDLLKNNKIYQEVYSSQMKGSDNNE